MYNIQLVKILVKGKDIKRYFVEYKNRAIIYPYHRVNGVFMPIEPDVLSTKYPKCFTYFEQNEKKNPVKMINLEALTPGL